MEKLTGLPSSFVLGKKATDIFPHLKKYGIDLLLLKALSGETVTSKDIPYFVEKTGKTGYTSGVYIPSYDKNGKIIGAIGLIQDTTEIKKYEEELKKNIQAKEMLLKELQHRVKNNLSLVYSFLSLQSITLDDQRLKSILEEAKLRIKSMTLIYEKLYQTDDISRFSIKPYLLNLIESIFSAYSIYPDKIRLNYEIADVTIDFKRALYIGLLINELLTNSIKYAFPGERKGEITIILKEDETHYTILFSDNGVGLPEGLNFENINNLGLRIVNLLTEQLHGDIKIIPSQGTSYKIIIDKGAT